MPSLSGSQSPMLKSLFSRRELEPLYVQIPSQIDAELNEKPHVPVIVLTPSTPTDGDHPPIYPAGRLPQPNARYAFCDDGTGELLDLDDQEDPTLKPVSRWPRLSSRTARVSVLLGVVAAIVLVHFVVIRALAPSDDDLATANF